MNYYFKIICASCEKAIIPSDVIYDKMAEQNYCPYCGWPTKEDHSE